MITRLIFDFDSFIIFAIQIDGVLPYGIDPTRPIYIFRGDSSVYFLNPIISFLIVSMFAFCVYFFCICYARIFIVAQVSYLKLMNAKFVERL